MTNNGRTTDNLIKDASQSSIQIGNSIQTNDATTVPVTSPLTLTGSIQTINVPVNAVEFIVYPVANLLKISEQSSMAQYDAIAAGSKESIPCAKANFIYIQGSAADTAYFRFTII